MSLNAGMETLRSDVSRKRNTPAGRGNLLKPSNRIPLAVSGKLHRGCRGVKDSGMAAVLRHSRHLPRLAAEVVPQTAGSTNKSEFIANIKIERLALNLPCLTLTLSGQRRVHEPNPRERKHPCAMPVFCANFRCYSIICFRLCSGRSSAAASWCESENCQRAVQEYQRFSDFAG